MSISEMIVRLEESGCTVQRIPGDNRTLHVDGYHHPQSKGLPDWLWDCPGWGVSSCGWGRAFLFKAW